MLKIFITATTLLLSCLHCQAQVKQVLSAPNRSNSAAAQTYLGLGTLASSDVEFPIEGTPYSNDDYVKGSIYHAQSIYVDVEMRYNIYYDRIEYKRRDSVLAIGPDKLIRKVVMGDQILIVNHHEVKGKPVLTYFLRLDSGKATLLAKKNIGFRDQRLGRPIEGDVLAKYVSMPDEHFIKIGDMPLVKIQTVKKLIEYLPDHKSKMEEFAKKEKISANKPKELIQFIQYYNSL